ncbi:KTSC domain-containing protein [Sphingopyxis sp.]|uniref:KTSC domain-containing protein n=1 Tax=Sphingopyxis sp. TaxID=1908224 RepID=UPI0032C2396C
MTMRLRRFASRSMTQANIVPAEIFDGLHEARSAGVFFNEHIKDRFRFQRDPGRRRFGPKA